MSTTRTTPIHVRKGSSTSTDARVAARELYEAVHDPDAALTIFYCSPRFDLDLLGAEIKRLFGPALVIGCTTAGEITPIGYLDGAITGVSLSGGGFRVSSARVDALSDFELSRGDDAAKAALAALRGDGPMPTGKDVFGFLLVDGLSVQEEALVASIYRNLGTIELVGGSAGDGTRFGRTYIYQDGAFRTDCAVLALVRSEHPFVVFKTEHFVASREKVVVTGADPTRRVVTEINGEPAAHEYARVVGLEVDALTPLIFAAHPVVVQVGGHTFVRSIQKMNDDGSLTFFCAIDEGIVLTVAEGVDMVSNLAAAFAEVRAAIGQPSLVLGCDCILRYLEAQQKDLCGKINEIMTANNVVGFATYGEQYNAMHVNQTFTGVAIGAGPAHV